MSEVPEPGGEDRRLRQGGLPLRGGFVLEVHGTVGRERAVSLPSGGVGIMKQGRTVFFWATGRMRKVETLGSLSS